MSETYRNRFTQIFWQCLNEGMTTIEAREYAALELGPPEKPKIKLDNP
jgi:hypothetical protein